jgi:hypothetical protein
VYRRGPKAAVGYSRMETVGWSGLEIGARARGMEVICSIGGAVAGDDQWRTLREAAMSSQTSSAKLSTGSSSEMYVHVSTTSRDVAGVGLFSERTTSVCPGLIWPGTIAEQGHALAFTLFNLYTLLAELLSFHTQTALLTLVPTLLPYA